MVGVTVENEIGVGLADPRQHRVLWVDLIPLPSTGWGLGGETPFPAGLQLETVRPFGEPAQQRAVDPLRLARAGPLRPEKALLVVAEDRVRAALLEQADELI